jgi:benzoate-CoA ligase family protein
VSPPAVTFADDFNFARYCLFDRLDGGLRDKAAILFGGRTYSYADVADRVARMRAVLESSDLRRGERFVVCLPDVPPFAFCLFGAMAHGSVVCMANPHAGVESLRYIVEYTRATGLVTTPEMAHTLVASLAETTARSESEGQAGSGASRGPWELRRIWISPDAPTDADPEGTCDGVDALAARAANLPLSPPLVIEELSRSLRAVAPSVARARVGTVATHRDEPCMWLFTSGSTGKPKAAMHTHRDFAFNTEVYAKQTVGYRASDVTVSVPRLFFGYATGTNLFFPFAVGATTALFSERPTPESLRAAIDRYRPTIVTNVPTMLGKLLDADDRAAADGTTRLDLSSVRFSLSAGEALPEPLLRRWTERFRSDVYDGIGSAEMFHIYASNRPGDVRPGSLGRAVRGYSLHVLPEDASGMGAELCEPGEIGVLWVKGDSVAQGYWLDRDKSWSTFHGHACRSGDLFRMDADGYLYFAGRTDELLKVGGQWVSPTEVEECLLGHPAVAHAAVVGCEVDGLVKPRAILELRPGQSPGAALCDDIQAFVRTRLAPHKYPRIVEFVDELPKNDRGKVDRKALRATPSERTFHGE